MNKNCHKPKIPPIKRSACQIYTQNSLTGNKKSNSLLNKRKVSPVNRFRKMTFHQDAENTMRIIEGRKNLSLEFTARSPLSNLENIVLTNEGNAFSNNNFEKSERESLIEIPASDLSDLKKKIPRIEIEKRESLAKQMIEKQEIEKKKTSFGFLPIYD